MTTYEYDPDAWHPALAGAVAGAIAGVVAALISLVLRSPDEIVANSLSVTLVSIALGAVSGMLWRRLRATDRPLWTFGWSMFGGWVVAMLAISFGHWFVLDNLLGYAAPLAAIIFITLGFLTPLLARVAVAWWIGLVVIAVAVVLGVLLFGRGNVASGDLSLDDLPAATTTTTVVDTESQSTGGDPTSTTAAADLSGEVTLPDDLAASYTVATGVATYEVPEVLQGLSTVGVGRSESVSGSFSPEGAFSFTLDLQSFVSDQSRRDSRVRGWFTDHPEGTFSGSTFTLPASAVVGEPVSFTISGDLTINEISLPTEWTIEARIETDGSLTILGETDIVLSDFEIPVQTSGFVTMEDAAHLEILVSAVPG